MPDKTSASRRIPELDGFRVLLVFIVAWFHIWQQSWLTPRVGNVSLDFLVRSGYMEVDGTILLSGFLLFLPWVTAAREGAPLPSARAFYRRRVARIVPSFVFINLAMLFAVALPQHQYRSTGDVLLDLLAHFTFTFNWFYKTYIGSPLGGFSWTIAVEMQMYLLFPWIARAAVKKPGAVLLGLCALSAYARGWFLWRYAEYQMVVNQLVSFFDVYAIGMAAALAYPALRERLEKARKKWPFQLLATALFALGIWLAVILLKEQARSSGYPDLQSGQMLRRPAWALILCCVMLSLPFSLKPLRLLFGNPVMHFLAGVSMNFYLIHQQLAVQLKRFHIPMDISGFANPAEAGLAWQLQYTWLSFGLSLLAAAAVTWLIEKPAAAGLRALWRRLDAAGKARAERKKAEAG